MSLINFRFLLLVLVIGSQAHAGGGLAPASRDVTEFLSELQQELKDIKSFGHICSGGGRKWAKIARLRARARSQVPQRLMKAFRSLDRSCVAVAETSGQLDPLGNELVIAQRIDRISVYSVQQKKDCRQFWSDWIVATKVMDAEVSPVLQIFEQACVNREPVPDSVDSPKSQSRQ